MARVQAVWNGTVLADSEDTVVVGGTHYFPREAVRGEHLVESPTRSVCPWKGKATYYSLVVDDEVNPDAAWSYPKPLPLARRVKGRVAFWRGVQVHPVPEVSRETSGPPRARDVGSRDQTGVDPRGGTGVGWRGRAGAGRRRQRRRLR